MDFNPYTHIKTLILHEDGSTSEEDVPAPEGYAPNFERQASHDAQWARVRYERDRLMAGCDWVVMRSVDTLNPVPAEWASYRQALRDVTAQENPFLIKWPEPPQALAPARKSYLTRTEVEGNVPTPKEV